MKQTIIIPKGVEPNVSIYDGKVIIDYEEPITGFVTVTDNDGGVHLLYVKKPIVSGKDVDFILWLRNRESLYINNRLSNYGTPYTVSAMSNEDKQLLLSELKKEGFMLDEEQGLVVKWEPKEDETYYSPNIFLSDMYSDHTNNTSPLDSRCIERGVAYPTAELAIKRAKRMLNTER